MSGKNTTGILLQSLAAITEEIRVMEDALRDAEQVTNGDRRQLRREIGELRRRTDVLIAWLAEARLEATKN